MKKLNEEQVFEIKKLIKEDQYTQNFIAKKFNVSKSAISNIRRGVTFKHIAVPDEEYMRGYEAGYKKGFDDGNKYKNIENIPVRRLQTSKSEDN